MLHGKQEMLEIINNVALMTFVTTCFGSFLFLVHLSGQPEGFYLSHHLSSGFYVLFSPTFPLLGKFIKTL